MTVVDLWRMPRRIDAGSIKGKVEMIPGIKTSQTETLPIRQTFAAFHSSGCLRKRTADRRESAQALEWSHACAAMPTACFVRVIVLTGHGYSKGAGLCEPMKSG